MKGKMSLSERLHDGRNGVYGEGMNGDCKFRGGCLRQEISGKSSGCDRKHEYS